MSVCTNYLDAEEVRNADDSDFMQCGDLPPIDAVEDVICPLCFLLMCNSCVVVGKTPAGDYCVAHWECHKAMGRGQPPHYKAASKLQ